jgi:hypothetical protein
MTSQANERGGSTFIAGQLKVCKTIGRVHSRHGEWPQLDSGPQDRIGKQQREVKRQSELRHVASKAQQGSHGFSRLDRKLCLMLLVGVFNTVDFDSIPS